MVRQPAPSNENQAGRSISKAAGPVACRVCDMLAPLVFTLTGTAGLSDPAPATVTPFRGVNDLLVDVCWVLRARSWLDGCGGGVRLHLEVRTAAEQLPWREVLRPGRALAYGLLTSSDPELGARLHLSLIHI